LTARQSLISLERRRPELKPPLGTCERSPPAWPICHWPATDPKKPQARLKQIWELTDRKESFEGKLVALSSEFAKMQEAARLSPPQQLQRFAAVLPRRTALIDVLNYLHNLSVAPDNECQQPQLEVEAAHLPTRRRAP
jgi:hypothetical protein